MTLGRAIMAISTLLAVAACADPGREAASSTDHGKAARDIATTIPSESDDAALPPRESDGPGVSSEPVAAPAKSPTSSPAVEPAKQIRDENATESHATKPKSAKAQDSAAEPAEPQENASQPPEPSKPRDGPPEPRDEAPALPKPADNGEPGSDGAKPRRSRAVSQAGETAEGQASVVGNNVSVARDAEAPLATADKGQAEQPGSVAAGSSTVDGRDAAAPETSANAIMPVPGVMAPKETLPLNPERKIGAESMVEPDTGHSGTSFLAAGDPGVDDLNRIAAPPPDSQDEDAVADAGEEREHEANSANEPLKCDVVRLLGHSIGLWRLQGEGFKTATGKAADEVARKIGTVADERLGFKARVYANRIYDLKPDHTPEGFAAYAHAACLILRGHKGLIPVDDTSKDLLDQALRGCESRGRGTGELDACISERMEKIVQERGRRTD